MKRRIDKTCLTCLKMFNVILARKNTAKYCCMACSKARGICTNTGRTHFKKIINSDEGNYNWKGQGASYSAIHQWLKRKLGKPTHCKFCDKTAGRFEWANISKEYKRDLNDYMPLCYKCHDLYDDRVGKWKERMAIYA